MMTVITLVALLLAMVVLVGLDSLVFRLWARRFTTWMPSWPLAMLAGVIVFFVAVLSTQTAMRLLQQANVGQKGMPLIKLLPLFATTLYVLPGLVKAGFLRQQSRRADSPLSWPLALLFGIFQSVISVTLWLAVLAGLVAAIRFIPFH